MGILVGGCVRTWEPAIARTLLWMAGIVDGTPPHVESGALVYMDGTDMELLSRLQEWTAAPSGQHAAIVGLDPPDSRLARLALCRNVLMVEATRKLAPTGVFISADMDCMLPELPTLLLAASFLNGQAVVPTATSGPYFDVVTANNYGYRHKAARTYRDRWALRSEGIDYDCARFSAGSPDRASPANPLDHPPFPRGSPRSADRHPCAAVRRLEQLARLE